MLLVVVAVAEAADGGLSLTFCLCCDLVVYRSRAARHSKHSSWKVPFAIVTQEPPFAAHYRDVIWLLVQRWWLAEWESPALPLLDKFSAVSHVRSVWLGTSTVGRVWGRQRQCSRDASAPYAKYKQCQHQQWVIVLDGRLINSNYGCWSNAQPKWGSGGGRSVHLKAPATRTIHGLIIWMIANCVWCVVACSAIRALYKNIS